MLKEVKLPKEITNDLAYLCGVFAGVADTDFGVSIKKKNYPVIVGASDTKQFMKEIGDELDKIKLSPLRYFDKKIKDSRFRKGYSIINRLELNGHNRLKIWMDEIGFRHPKHLKKVKRVAKVGFEPTT